jgi:hypothetical protein
MRGAIIINQGSVLATIAAAGGDLMIAGAGLLEGDHFSFNISTTAGSQMQITGTLKGSGPGSVVSGTLSVHGAPQQYLAVYIRSYP